MEAPISRRYIAVLSVIAVLVLAIGARLRPTKAPKIVTPSEIATLQRRVQREDLRDMASYFASRAQESSRHVVALSGGRSGVSWGRPGQLLAAGEPNDPAPLVLLPASAPLPIPPFPSTLPGERWVVSVARQGNDDLIWTPALNSARRSAECRGVGVEELVLTVPVAGLKPGSAVFDLDGMLAGVVADCEDQQLAIAAGSIPALLDAFRDPRLRLLPIYGFDAVPLNADTQPAFGDSTGLLVREVRDGSIAFRNGLRAGDLILLTEGSDLPSLLATAVSGTPVDLPVRRAGRPRTLTWEASPPARDGGIRPAGGSQAGVPVTVDEGTPPYHAGLRSGDRLLQVGDRPVQRPADLQRIFRGGEQPLLMVFQRGDAQMATVVRP